MSEVTRHIWKQIHQLERKIFALNERVGNLPARLALPFNVAAPLIWVITKNGRGFAGDGTSPAAFVYDLYERPEGTNLLAAGVGPDAPRSVGKRAPAPDGIASIGYFANDGSLHLVEAFGETELAVSCNPLGPCPVSIEDAIAASANTYRMLDGASWNPTCLEWVDGGEGTGWDGIVANNARGGSGSLWEDNEAAIAGNLCDVQLLWNDSPDCWTLLVDFDPVLWQGKKTGGSTPAGVYTRTGGCDTRPTVTVTEV